jgi:hypothetical protein
MYRLLPGVVKRGLKAVGSRVIERLRKWTKPDNHGLAGGAVADAACSKAESMLENALLRQQLIVLDRQVERLQLTWRERGIMHGAAGQQAAGKFRPLGLPTTRESRSKVRLHGKPLTRKTPAIATIEVTSVKSDRTSAALRIEVPTATTFRVSTPRIFSLQDRQAPSTHL